MVIEIKKEDIKKVIEGFKGRLFSISFNKVSDGAQRTLTGRMHVTKKLVHKDDKVKPTVRKSKKVITMYDVKDGAYKSVNFDTVLSLKGNKNTYLVIGK